MRFLLRFMYFFGSEKLLKFLLQRLIHINASRASWELIFDALKSCDRWLFNAYRFVFQLVIFGRNGIKRIGAFFGTKYFGKKLQKRVPKMDVLGPKNCSPYKTVRPKRQFALKDSSPYIKRQFALY